MLNKQRLSGTRVRCICLILATATCLVPLATAFALEEIHSFHSDIRIHTDGTMDVIEKINVSAEGRKIKRGIYRDFPTDYKDRFGNRYKVGFDVIRVRRNGQKEDFHTRSIANGVRVYVGSEDKIIAPGNYTYEIYYRTDRQIGFFDAHDELYWNVTGNEWAFTIAHASATVHLPKGAARDDLMAEGYTGPRGSRRSDLTATLVSGSEARFETTRPLDMREGLTIVLGWPKGIVLEPTEADLVAAVLRDNAHLLAGLIGFAALVGYFLFFWARVGKDPEPGIIIAHYEPPKGYSPASMRYIKKMGYDKQCFSAAVLNLAVKGFLTIEEKGRAYTLVRTGKDVVMAPGEEKIGNALFRNRKRIELDNKNHGIMKKALAAHEAALSNDYENKYFITNSDYFFGGVAISMIVVAASFFLHPEIELSRQGALPALLAPVLLSVIGMAIYRALIQLRHSHWVGLASLFKSGLTLVFIIFWMGAAGPVLDSIIKFGSWALVLICIALPVTNALFYHLLKAPTLVGRKLLDKADGFKHYVQVAEKHELDAHYPEGRTPELFERYLPYAVALDIEQEWAEQFANVIKEAAEGDAGYSPAWYHGSDWRPSRVSAFSSSLSGAFVGAVAAASVAPGSSSGFGGGGSGGGGGGGGGGGW